MRYRVFLERTVSQQTTVLIDSDNVLDVEDAAIDFAEKHPDNVEWTWAGADPAYGVKMERLTE